MSALDRFRASAARLGEHFGEPVTLERKASVRGGGRALSSFLSDLAPAGAVRLRLTPEDGGRLRGSLPSGLEITIGVVVYRLAADATAENDSIEVDIEPPLLSGLADGTGVTLAANVRHQLQHVVVSGPRLAYLRDELAQVATFEASIPQASNTIRPQLGDVLELTDGRRATILEEPAGNTGSWDVVAGNGAQRRSTRGVH